MKNPQSESNITADQSQNSSPPYAVISLHFSPLLILSYSTHPIWFHLFCALQSYALCSLWLFSSVLLSFQFISLKFRKPLFQSSPQFRSSCCLKNKIRFCSQGALRLTRLHSLDWFEEPKTNLVIFTNLMNVLLNNLNILGSKEFFLSQSTGSQKASFLIKENKEFLKYSSNEPWKRERPDSLHREKRQPRPELYNLQQELPFPRGC